MVQLNYRDARPIYTQIFDGFRDQILAGVLQQGDKLPSVRELASMLTINPNTIQRAYRELEAEGWIATVPGKGCFVCGAPYLAVEETAQLWQEFDALTQRMKEAGITLEEITAHLEQGGKQDA